MLESDKTIRHAGEVIADGTLQARANGLLVESESEQSRLHSFEGDGDTSLLH